MNVHELAKTLKAINEGVIPEAEAKAILARVNPVDLSLAEQELIKEGTKPEELRKLCDVHLKLIQMEAADLKKQLAPDHPLHTLYTEHDLILGFLDTLEATAERLVHKEAITTADPDLKTLREVAELLVDTEKHHAREEEALFPAIEAKGITGPTRIMRMEHDELRAKKQALRTLVKTVDPIQTPDLKFRVMELATFIVSQLREHIVKENAILYPSAFQELTETGIWESIKTHCDQIGYCSFTPRGNEGKRVH